MLEIIVMAGSCLLCTWEECWKAHMAELEQIFFFCIYLHSYENIIFHFSELDQSLRLLLRSCVSFIVVDLHFQLLNDCGKCWLANENRRVDEVYESRWNYLGFLSCSAQCTVSVVTDLFWKKDFALFPGQIKDTLNWVFFLSWIKLLLGWENIRKKNGAGRQRTWSSWNNLEYMK